MALIQNISPKQRFIFDEKNVRAHRELIARDDLQTSLDFALMQYLGSVAITVADGPTAAAAGYKMQGVYEYLQGLRMLAEAPTPISRAQVQGIDYTKA